MKSARSSSNNCRIAVVGVHGYGASHVDRVARLAESGQVVFAAVADPRPDEGNPSLAGIPAYGDLTELLAAEDVDIVIVSTPIHTHVDLAEQALRAGADVLLEKPPAPTLSDFRRLENVVADTGQICQVGFQSMGSFAVRALVEFIDTGRLGEIEAVGGVGAWVRTQSYWQRTPWAGRRELDGRQVLDGAVTNPFAHAVVTALRLAGAQRVEDVVSVETELFRANPIEADDTSVVRIRTAGGPPVVLALTLCASEVRKPSLVVRGSAGSARLSYVEDLLEITIDGSTERTSFEREDLLVNLIEHRADPSVPLLSSLSSTGAFECVVEAVRQAKPPAPIADQHVVWVRDPQAPGDDRPIVTDVEQWLGKAVDSVALFSEIGAPWAVDQPAEV
ncbi:Gfo/Idh/MocA family protein [Kribbella deserti]|uniref:Gfo/Idh/MocA family protein n=1 Tax=Kribbella deserti TaxID=1926257 RepID=A0ABV6QHN9_9ACTN